MSSAASGAISRVFSFDYYYKLDDAAAQMQVQYSCNGGSSWTVFTGGTFQPDRWRTDGQLLADHPLCHQQHADSLYQHGHQEGQDLLLRQCGHLLGAARHTRHRDLYPERGPGRAPDPACHGCGHSHGLSQRHQRLHRPDQGRADDRHRAPQQPGYHLAHPGQSDRERPAAALCSTMWKIPSPSKRSRHGQHRQRNWTTNWEEENDNADPKDGDIKVDDDERLSQRSCLSVRSKPTR